MCLCVSSTDSAQNISKVQTALEARCLTLRVIGLTVSHSHTDGEADWHNDMFIEKLWIIEKVVAAAGMSQPLTKKHGHEISYLDTHTHARTHTPHHNSLWKREKTYSNAQDETVITVSTSSFLHEKFTVTHMREVFFIGTAKAIRCLSQQQQNKTFCTFHKSLGAQSEWVFTLDLKWEHFCLAALQRLDWKVTLTSKEKVVYGDMHVFSLNWTCTRVRTEFIWLPLYASL